jgi:CheY-like chemotaxis protein
MDDLEKNPAVEEEPKKPLKILLVEDEAPIVEYVVTTLRKKGAVDFVDNAEDALDKLRQAKEKGEEYDWLITDWHLPVEEQTGFYLVEQMKEQELGTNTFKTLFTGSERSLRDLYPTDEDLEKLTGIQQLIGKPFNRDQFLNQADQIRDWQKSREQA